MSSTWRVSRPFVVVMAIIAAVSIGIGLNLTLAPVAQAQAGLSTGSIQGTILDPHGSSVPAAKVSITSKATGAKLQAEVSPSGTYISGPLVPGEYAVRVEAPGFNTVELPATVQVGNITTSSVTLEVGATTTVISVEGAARALLRSNRSRTCPSTAAISWTLLNSNLACKFKTAAISIRRKRAFRRFPLEDDLAARRVLRSMAWISATRPLVRPRRIFRSTPSKNFR